MHWRPLAVLAVFAMLGRTLADTIADDIRNNNHRASTSDDAPHWVSAPKELIHGEKEDVSDQLELVPRDATGSSSLHGGPAPANEGFDGHTAEVQTYIGEKGLGFLDGERCHKCHCHFSSYETSAHFVRLPSHNGSTPTNKHSDVPTHTTPPCMSPENTC